MLAGVARISLVALLASMSSYVALPVGDAGAESIERQYYPRTRSKQPANSAVDASDDRAATTVNSVTNWLRPSPPSVEGHDALSSRTQIYSGNRSVAPMLNTRSAPALEFAILVLRDYSSRRWVGPDFCFQITSPGWKRSCCYRSAAAAGDRRLSAAQCSRRPRV